MKILIVEDNNILRENLIFLLKKFHYLGEGASHGKEALQKLTKTSYDAIILDINMPIMDGKEFLKQFKMCGKVIPIIALTSDSMLADKLEMFDLGVDDYITKPFEIEELVARLKSILKRSDKKIDDQKKIGKYTVNYSSNKVLLKKTEIIFSYKQYLIIEFLSKNYGYPQNKLKIMEYVWGEAEENLDFNSTTLESHIYSIRKKLGKDFIKTIKGIGYIID
ncbi:response regulator transcription factor [Candidatus Gracilibacteria bacterium 28_42_T64]|nr:response regulator transcription factor [Candidatus Gracilibacteria bacterium 28_42_T64]